MGEIIVGTSGFSYDDWVGPFYPPTVPQSEFLSFYARNFGMTELNFSYYRLPDAETTAGMVDRTPESFRFAIKAHRTMTHDVTGGWRDAVDRFVDGIAPLTDSKRLLGVLLQFPYRFHYTTGNRKYLASLCRALEGLPLYLEFRHKEWEKPSVYEQMDEMDLGRVFTDMPRLHNLPTSPLVAEGRGDRASDSSPDRAAGDVNVSDADGGAHGGSFSHLAIPAGRAYIRFHGRNDKNWWDGDNVSRYDYRYSKEELDAWVPVIAELTNRTSILVAAFNNHANANAVANARQLIAMLGTT